MPITGVAGFVTDPFALVTLNIALNNTQHATHRPSIRTQSKGVGNIPMCDRKKYSGSHLFKTLGKSTLPLSEFGCKNSSNPISRYLGV